MTAFLSQIEYADAKLIVSAFLGLSALAWGSSFIARLILNR